MGKAILVFLCFLILGCLQANSIAWNFFQRSNPNDSVMPDGDEYGNPNVWWFKYGPAGVSDPSQYQLMTWNSGKWDYPEGTPVHYPDYSLGSNTMHPSQYQDAVIQFKSPVSGIFNIQMELSRYYSLSQGDGFNVYVQKNNTILWSGFNGGSVNLSNVVLNQNDSIYLRLNNGGSNNEGYDRMNVTTFLLTGVVPEPSSLLLFLLGFLVYRASFKK
ncbi:MAG: PEP-CTERM sorting domain-containing protein [Candidatus Brocadiae bacterium]|nr:PEP-CTERM sorting domain-containing protein [Candidatus Brocadiia bacterium]